MRRPFFSSSLLLLNLVLLGARVSAQAIRRRPSPKVVPKNNPPLHPKAKEQIAVRRAPSPKAVPKKSKASKSTPKGKALKRPPPRKPVILPNGRSHVKYDDKRRRHRQGRISVPRDLSLSDADELNVQLFDVMPVRNYKRKPNLHRPADTVSFYYGENENESSRINLLQTKTSDGNFVLAGSVHESGTVYQIRQLPNGEVTVTSTHSRDFHPEIHHHNSGLQNRIESPPVDKVEGVQFASNSTNGRRLADDGSVLDVMVIYTQNAMCAAANQSYGCPANSVNQGIMEALINLAVEETNVAYGYSDIPMQLRLVHIHYEADYDDHVNNDWQATLNSLHDANDGIFDYVPAMRSQYGADFVSMLIDSGQYCGLSFLPIPPTGDDAYSLVLWSCATGYYSFGHELGHNMGCYHDRPDAGVAGLTGTGYNFGYQYLDEQSYGQQFRTILSYDCPGGCHRLQRFSNPSQLFQGLPLGTPTTDNARWMRERVSIYANYMPEVITPSPSQSATASAIQSGNTVIASSSSGSSDDFLATTFSGGLVGVAGNVFSVVAKNDLTVTNFAVQSYAATTVTVEVWKRMSTGGCKGFQHRRNDWEQIGVASFVSSPSGQPSVLPTGSMAAVPIRAGDQQCFYVTFSGSTNYNRFSRGVRLGRTYKSNNDMGITEGYAVGYQFGQSLHPRVFNGEVFYNLGIGSDVAPTVTPTAAKTSPAPTTPPSSQSSSLDVVATTFDGGNGQAGNMFDIKASTTVTIRALDVHTLSRSTQTIRVYTKTGSLVGSENNSSAWTLICSSRVRGQGSSSPTHLPERALRPVTIPAGEVQAFYVTFTKAIIRYTTGNVAAKNSDIQFLRSVGNKYRFGDIYSERIWNGKLYYSTGAAADSFSVTGTSNFVDEVGIFKNNLFGDHALFSDEEMKDEGHA